jgi:hypothetical protein
VGANAVSPQDSPGAGDPVDIASVAAEYREEEAEATKVEMAERMGALEAGAAAEAEIDPQVRALLERPYQRVSRETRTTAISPSSPNCPAA